MGSDDVLIRLSNVSFRYDTGAPVLDGLDFGLRRGQRVGLVGHNGSGKTTILHLIMGLLRPNEGMMEILGKPRTKEKDFHEVRRRIGLVFQDPEDQLFCPTVAEDVAFGPFNLGMTREQVQQTVSETLKKLGLEGFEKRITYKLSFGEKRLVSLAAVMAMKPEVLLLDEPLAALDKEVAERVAKVLEELDVSVLVVSHNEEFLRHIASERVLLKNGRIEPLSP